MKNILLVARHCFRQVIRQKTFVNVGIFGLGMVVVAVVVSRISYGSPDRMVRSIGLSGIVLSADLLALLLGVSLIYRDIEDRTLYVIFARPVRRFEYVLGRHLGLVLAVLLVVVGAALCWWLALTMSRGSLTAPDIAALVAAVPEVSVMAGLGLLISSFTTPTVGAGLGLGVWVAASAADDLRRLTEGQDSFAAQLLPYLTEVLPQLWRFNFRDQAVYGGAVETAAIGSAWLYGFLYSAALLGFTALVLSRREFR